MNGKILPVVLLVLTVSHTEGGLNNSVVGAALQSFVNDGGVYCGHIHGHEHCDNYKKSYGFNNVGLNASLINRQGDSLYAAKKSGYTFDLFDIDLDNKIMYDIRIGIYKERGSGGLSSPELYRSEDRVFSFGDNHSQIV